MYESMQMMVDDTLSNLWAWTCFFLALAGIALVIVLFAALWQWLLRYTCRLIRRRFREGRT